MRIRLEHLRLKPNIPAGMNPYRLLGLVELLRTSDEDHPPITVAHPCPTCGTYQVQDGRHRMVASLLAGRPDIAAEDV